MAATSFYMELRVNFNDEHRASKDEMLKVLMAKFANVLLANAMLLKDRSEPYISLVMSDGMGDDMTRVNISEHPVTDECPTCGHAIERHDEEDC